LLKDKKMDQGLGRIIRGNEAKLEGSVTLQIGQQRAMKQSGSAKLADNSAKAACIESHPGFAVIEVTCRCGEKIYLRCEYAGSENYQASRELEDTDNSAKTKNGSQQL
jgi:hypothetical protein